MLHYLTDATRAALATATGVPHRLRSGPTRPSWTLRQEVLVRSLREAFQGAQDRPIEDVRAQFDQIDWLERLRGRTRRSWRDIDGVRTLWTTPPVPTGGIVVYLHGGGYVFGSNRSHAVLMADLATASGATLVGVDYRLAPEHPYPAAIDDTLKVWTALLRTGLDPRHMALAGDSAGGGLVITSMLEARARGVSLPAAALCISPWVDLTLSGRSHHTNRRYDYIGDLPLLARFARCVAGDTPLTHPGLSPALHDLPKLPPLLIQVGGAEVLLDDARSLARRARKGNTRVELEIWRDQVHVWHAFSRAIPESWQAIRQAGQWIRAEVGGA